MLLKYDGYVVWMSAETYATIGVYNIVYVI